MSDTVTLLIVRATFVILIVSSALTWALVLLKAIQHWRLSRQDHLFTKVYGGAFRLPTAADLAKFSGPATRLALAGVASWRESGETAGGDAADLDVRRDLLERELRQQLNRERRGVESGLPVLASIGSTAPFVGLFGTVLGIVHALQRISGSGSASLDVVAGPIGEALVATAIGIAVAVPAVLAYNFYLRRLKTFVAELEDFANGFVSSAIKSFVHIEPIAAPAETSIRLPYEARA